MFGVNVLVSAAPSTTPSSVKSLIYRGLPTDIARQQHDFDLPPPNPLGEQHESRAGFYRVLRPFIRPIDREAAKCEWMSSSAIKRHENKPGYAPPNLTEYLTGQHQVMDV